MKIRVGNSWSEVLDASPAEMAWLEEYVGCDVERYVPGAGRLVERFTMLDGACFASGLVPLIASAAQAETGSPVELVDMRPSLPGVSDAQADLAWLRDYQADALTALVAVGRGVCQAPTAAGKSEVIIGLTRALPEVEHLCLIHRSDLVRQLSERYMLRTKERAGAFVGGVWRRGTCNFTVATFQSLASARRSGAEGLDELRSAVGAVHVDECHATPAATYYSEIQGLHKAQHRFGFSGTPLKRSGADTLRTVGALGPLVYRISAQTLIDRGLLARPQVRMRPLEQYSTPDSDWLDVYADLVVRSPARNALVADMALSAAKPCLVFFDNLKQGQLLVLEMEKRGLRVGAVWGRHSLDFRAEALQQLQRGELDVLACSVIFQEGVDAPALASVVIGGGKKSYVAAIQRVGRGMRISEGKSSFEVWDVLDKGQSWLAKHARGRRRAYLSEGYDVEVLKV